MQHRCAGSWTGCAGVVQTSPDHVLALTSITFLPSWTPGSRARGPAGPERITTRSEIIRHTVLPRRSVAARSTDHAAAGNRSMGADR